ncbi:MAG: HD domain-containing protein [Phycisphaerales bacterium]|nr:HD domain-containing protein [Phycisphaerales bacterium]
MFISILLMQIAVILVGELLINAWIGRAFELAPILADRLFVFRMSIALCVLTLSGLTMIIASKRYGDVLESTNEELGREVERQLASGLKKRNALIFGLAKLADYRDTDTGAHLERIGLYARILADELSGTYQEIDHKWTDRLVLASSLHDIGKVGIADAILLKPGRFTPEERTEMEKHALIGADTLLAIRAKLGPDEFIDMGIQIALQHHEKWDGTGYPFNLKGEEISLAARIVALADFYDALTSVRVYKDAMEHSKTMDLIVSLRGTHFAPDVADAFVANEALFNRIRKQMQGIRHGLPELTKLEIAARKYMDDQGNDQNGLKKAA